MHSNSSNDWNAKPCLGRMVCFVGLLISTLLAGINPSNVAAQQVELLTKEALPFLKQFCFDCHDTGIAEGDIDLGQLADGGDDPELWVRLLHEIESGRMPPTSADQPLPEQVDRLRSQVLQSLEAGTQRPPMERIRRLNRIEYENTIRDLFRLSRNCFNNSSRLVKTTDYFQPSTERLPRYVFAVSYFYNSQQRHSDLPGVASLPIDPPVEHGFANEASALSISPLLMENYFSVAADLLASSEFEEISSVWNSLFVCDAAESVETKRQRAQLRLAVFLPRAFRAPVPDSVLQRYVDLFDAELDRTSDYAAAMKTTVAAILVSPKFLLRREFAAGDVGQVDPLAAENFAIANRLSYFLWSSMPDDILFQAAREGRLTDTEELRRQVRRMLKDDRIKSLSTEFGMQWLKVYRAASVAPDADRYPEYYRSSHRLPPVAVSMMIEQLLLFETVMVENRNILDFLDADFAYLNRQLMDWYQIEPAEVLGYSPAEDDFEDFFRVRWPVGHRGGVLTAGATLISTSTTTRTSPVYRGAWILDVILNRPPPAPPANVPALESQGAGSSSAFVNVRQRLEEHRRNPMCASCHDRLDPLGFAMENFDAVGKWRSEYASGEPVDSSASYQAETFSGAAKLKAAFRRDSETFVRAFVEHMAKFALGRQLNFSDEVQIRQIAAEVMERDNRFQAVVEAIVLSELFRGQDLPESLPKD